MKINFNAIVIGINGIPMQDQNGKELTLGMLASDVLLKDFRDKMPAEQKIKQYKLAKMVLKGGEFELLKDGVEQIKNSLGRMCPPALLGAAMEALEGE